MGRSPESPFVRTVKRAFADALVAEIRRSRLGRDDAAKSGNVSRAYLQLLLAADRHATIGTLISLAEGLGLRPEELMAKTMEHLDRLRPAPERTEPPSERSAT
ncbi:hypothetical protein ACFPN2_21010 [Steroidobacter flavus]|uniref:HTH cro/C1-type domain-containing protein n=1 Tax=Steroidobacter flavus TaxID=1842136 RepID=A0ABV8SX46_9GAMM